MLVRSRGLRTRIRVNSDLGHGAPMRRTYFGPYVCEVDRNARCDRQPNQYQRAYHQVGDHHERSRIHGQDLELNRQPFPL
jgi:hypothetical protein